MGRDSGALVRLELVECSKEDPRFGGGRGEEETRKVQKKPSPNPPNPMTLLHETAGVGSDLAFAGFMSVGCHLTLRCVLLSVAIHEVEETGQSKALSYQRESPKSEKRTGRISYGVVGRGHFTPPQVRLPSQERSIGTNEKYSQGLQGGLFG